MSKSLRLGLFVIVILIQLYVPAQMILQREDILQTGTPFRFETRPIDPVDPFRGKYVRLGYKVVEADIPKGWPEPPPDRNTEIYVELQEDEKGMMDVKQLHVFPPSHTSNYVKASVNAYFNDEGKISFRYPFDRYYMDEFKAKPAEDWVREASRDSSLTSYALVYVQDGEAVIADVLIGDQSLKEVLERAE